MRKPAIAFVLLLPLFAAERRPLEVTTTESVDAAPVGTLRIDGSWGYLSVDGWDESRVDIAVTKSTDRFYKPAQEAEAKRRLDLIHVAVGHPSPSEVVITTTRAKRAKWPRPLPSGNKEHVTVEYRIRAPRDSKLIVHHDTGYVWISDIKGPIDAISQTGDMIVMLPGPAQYAIDARSKMGGVFSEIQGDGLNQFLIGTRFVRPGEVPSTRVYLRMGRGNITIKRN
jgi:hypothetical protein